MLVVRVLTSKELDVDQHPLRHALAIQQAIERLQIELEGLQVEYNQIILHCKEKGISKQDGYTVCIRRREIRKVDPDLFARTFPEENVILVQKQAAFMGTELDKLVQSKVLPSITVKDAEELVGKIPLMKACVLSVSEKITIEEEKIQ
jgi:hypothetical protein